MHIEGVSISEQKTCTVFLEDLDRVLNDLEDLDKILINQYIHIKTIRLFALNFYMHDS